MITHVDHLTLSSVAFDTHRARLGTLGFVERFCSRDVPNPSIKKPLMREYRSMHSLSLFDAPRCLSIEIIDQGTEFNSSPVYPIFSGIFPEYIEREEKVTFGGKSYRQMWLRDIASPVLACTGDVFTLHSCIMCVPDVPLQTRLMQQLGFTTHQEAESVTCELRSPLNSRLTELILVPGEVSPIDDSGFSYLALVSASLHNDRESLMRAGFMVTEVEGITVQDRELELFFITGPNILPIEIVGVKK